MSDDPKPTIPAVAAKVGRKVRRLLPRTDNAHLHTYALWVAVALVAMACPEVKGPLCGIVHVPIVCSASPGELLGLAAHVASAIPAPSPSPTPTMWDPTKSGTGG